MKTMKRRFGDLEPTQYQRSERLTSVLANKPTVENIADESPLEAINKQMQTLQKTADINESSNSAFQSDQFESVAAILGG